MASDLLLDRDLTARDIQPLSDADAIAAFFATLGYDTSDRIQQTVAAMGITADTVRRKVQRIERIANQENGALQVYLVLLDTVTLAAIQGLGRALCDRSGNYLLVLTSDFQTLDFVLLERELPSVTTAGITQPHVIAYGRGYR